MVANSSADLKVSNVLDRCCWWGGGGETEKKRETGICSATDNCCKECEAQTDLSSVSNDSVSVHDTEAYVYTNFYRELETIVMLPWLKVTKQLQAKVNPPHYIL